MDVLRGEQGGDRGMVLICSGTMKEVRNSHRRALSPNQCGGMEPERRLVAMGERLVNVGWSWIVPLPQGNTEAARKCCLLKRGRLVSMDFWSRSESHVISVSGVLARKPW